MNAAIGVQSMEKAVHQVFQSLFARLIRDQHVYPAADYYGPSTRVLNHFLEPPLDINDELTQDRIQKAADDLLLQIREGSYERFVQLPVPNSVELACTCGDGASGLFVRYVRLFDPMKMQMVTCFSVGVS